MSFDIQQFSGLTEDLCIYGGYSLTMMSNESRGGEFHKHGAAVLMPHGPFCWSAPNIPFIGGKIRSLTFPRGTHRLTVYAYSDLFNIDISVEISRGECTSITNICAMALLLFQQNVFLMKIHNHVDSTWLVFKTSPTGMVLYTTNGKCKYNLDAYKRASINIFNYPMYADDTTLYFNLEDIDFVNINNNINIHLEKIKLELN